MNVQCNVRAGPSSLQATCHYIVEISTLNRRRLAELQSQTRPHSRSAAFVLAFKKKEASAPNSPEKKNKSRRR